MSTARRGKKRKPVDPATTNHRQVFRNAERQWCTMRPGHVASRIAHESVEDAITAGIAQLRGSGGGTLTILNIAGVVERTPRVAPYSNNAAHRHWRVWDPPVASA